MENQTLLIFTPKTTLRIKYILNLYFKDIYDIPFKIINSPEEFIASSLPKISYGDSQLADEFHISLTHLLIETGIKEQNISIGEFNGLKTLFKTDHNHTIPFDIFAATFYLISRYEEYLPHIADKYDRFEADSSLAWQHGFLKQPLVNFWAEELKLLLQQKFPLLEFKKQKFTYTSTIDIDNAFAFKQKGVMRTIGGYGRSVVNFFWVDFVERTKVLLGKMKDPYDTYDLQLRIQKQYNLDVIYFFLLGDYGVNDKNLPSNNLRFQALIKHLNDYADVGIHPSFGSSGNPDQVKREINRLSGIVHKEITNSRQHFLNLSFPETYKILIENGITNDYTMGYASQIGFRASICTSYYWYDLDLETETNLCIHPFCVMDATLRFYMKVAPEEVVELVKPLIADVRKVNGQFVTIWHNETISNWREWKGWENIYEDVVKMIVR